MTSLDSFKCRKTLKVGGKTYVYYSLPTAEKNGLKGISKLPYSMKVLLENLLRNEDGRTVRIALTTRGRERLETLAASHLEELARLTNQMHTLWAGLDAET